MDSPLSCCKCRYMLPLLNNTMSPLMRADLVFVSERVMKMAVPNIVIWLLGLCVQLRTVLIV